MSYTAPRGLVEIGAEDVTDISNSSNHVPWFVTRDYYAQVSCLCTHTHTHTHTHTPHAEGEEGERERERAHWGCCCATALDIEVDP